MANKENRQRAEEYGLPDWYEVTERGGPTGAEKTSAPDNASRSSSSAMGW